MTKFVPERIVCVVGAPRSGTTSLCDYLKGHPDIAFSVVKEPHYFSQFDLRGLSDQELRKTITDEYLGRFFPDIPRTKSVLAEGSVTYLYRPEQMLPILRIWPKAKFIIAVRDPMELLPSLHQRLLYIGDEVVTDFSRAWAMTDDRREGRKVPPTCIDPRWLLYDEVGQLGKYVENFVATVGRERCFISVFDDLIRDPATMYGQILDFIGLPADGRTDFAAKRASRGFRYGFLQRLLKRPPKAVRGIAAGEQYRHRVRTLHEPSEPSSLTTAILAGRKRLLRWNAADAPRTSLDGTLRRDIRERLKDDVDRLSTLLDRDLSHWLADASPDDRSTLRPS